MSRGQFTKEETRARIVAKANELFRQFGYTKTSVADIAADLRMSTANIYTFFSSKNAIIQAGADSSLCELRDALLKITRGPGQPLKRMEEIALFIYRNHKKKFSRERQIYKLVSAAFEENWPCVRDFQKILAACFTEMVEEGVRAGQFHVADVAGATRTVLDSLTWIMHPFVFQELEHKGIEERLHAQFRLIEKALK